MYLFDFYLNCNIHFWTAVVAAETVLLITKPSPPVTWPRPLCLTTDATFPWFIPRQLDSTPLTTVLASSSFWGRNVSFFFLRFRHIFFLPYYLFWPWSEVWSAAMAVNSVHWFRKCLRLHDNPALQEAVNAAHTLRCVYILDPWFAGAANVGINRWR